MSSVASALPRAVLCVSPGCHRTFTKCHCTYPASVARSWASTGRAADFPKPAEALRSPQDPSSHSKRPPIAHSLFLQAVTGLSGFTPRKPTGTKPATENHTRTTRITRTEGREGGEVPQQCTKVIFLPEMTLAGRFPVSQCMIPNSRPGETLTGQRAGAYGGGWQMPKHTQTSKKLGQMGRGKGGSPCMCGEGLSGCCVAEQTDTATSTGRAPSPAGGKPGAPHSLLLRREKEAARRNN